MRKLVPAFILITLLFNLSTLAFNIKPVKAWGETFYIRADGSVDPPTAPISSVDNITYYFTNNTEEGDTVVVERSNIIIDGDGYGLFFGEFVLSSVDNVTIQDMNIDEGGITLSNVNNTLIQNSSIRGSGFSTVDGIGMSDAINVTIQNMNIDDAGITSSNMINVTIQNMDIGEGGITLSNVNNTLIQNSSIRSGGEGPIGGIGMSDAINVTIQNMCIRSEDGGVRVNRGSYVTIRNSEFDTWHNINIKLLSSSLNLIHGNIFIGGNAIYLSSSSFNSIYNNTLSGLEGNWGIHLSSSSNNNTVSGNNMVRKPAGISIHDCSNNTISRNNIINSDDIGIDLLGSSHNIFYGNNIINNDNHGIMLGNSSDNKFYHNNFDNIQNVYDRSWEWPSINIWDDGYPSGGNYWSDYVGLDSPNDSDLNKSLYQNESGRDGIGDSPYVIDANNVDNYPFMDSFPNPPWFPISLFSYSPAVPIFHDTVTFNASASYDSNGPIVSYIWDFGDGSNSTETTPITTHAYNTMVGDCYVTLTVVDNDGLNDSTTELISIGKMPNSVSVVTSSYSTFVGFRVNITGALQDVHGNGVADETVVLYYTPSGITAWTPITSDTTDSLGRYFAIWIPPATGYFVIKAEWMGNVTHFGVSNTTTLSSLVYESQYIFSVESNSTISELAFNTQNWKLSFSASGPNGTRGYVRVTVAKSLVADIANIRVYMDGRQFNFSIASIDDSWLLTFNYVHSIHQVAVDLDINIIPEFSSFLITALFMIATLLAAIVYRGKKHF